MENENRSDERNKAANQDEVHIKSANPKLMYTLVPELNESTTNNQYYQPANLFHAQTNFGMQRMPASPYYYPQQNYIGQYRTPSPGGYRKKPFYRLNTMEGVQKQLCYYFSEENLMKDEFIKSKMDTRGFVNVAVIENFPRMKNARTSREFILDSARKSNDIEVIGDYLRSKHCWWKFIDKKLNERPQSTLENSKPTGMTKEEYEQIRKEQHSESKSNVEEPNKVKTFSSQHFNYNDRHQVPSQNYYPPIDTQQPFYGYPQGFVDPNMAQNYFYAANTSGYVLGPAQFNLADSEGVARLGGVFAQRGERGRRRGGRRGRGSHRRARRRYPKDKAEESTSKTQRNSPEKKSSSSPTKEHSEDIEAVEQKIESEVSELTAKLEKELFDEKDANLETTEGK